MTYSRIERGAQAHARLANGITWELPLSVLLQGRKRQTLSVGREAEDSSHLVSCSKRRVEQ